MIGAGLVGPEVDGAVDVAAATAVLPAVGTVGHPAAPIDDHAASAAATAVLPAVGHAPVITGPAGVVPGPREAPPTEIEPVAVIAPGTGVDAVPAELAAVAIPPETIAALTAPPEPAAPTEIPLLERLVADAVTGDAEAKLRAKQRLLAEIHPLVLRYCRGRLGRQETVIGSADDVAQEVCLAVVGALPNYTIKGLSFRAFVYGIAAHKVTDAFRAIGRNRSEPMAELPDTAILHDGPEQRLLAGELAERLGDMLHRLTPRQREVLILRIVAGLSAEEVAHIVGSTPGAVRVTQHRALNRLRAVMAGRAGTEDSLIDD
jgi:RNA polymerase sigma-70 factor, ECF subfamily